MVETRLQKKNSTSNWMLPTISGLKYAYGSHLHRWIHKKAKIKGSHCQIKVRSKSSFNTIHNKIPRLRQSLLDSSRLQTQWSIITFINALTLVVGLSIQYNYLHYFSWILTWITRYNISAPAPSGQSCHLRFLKVTYMII